jgi:Tol biopolymer transport system component
MRSVRTLGFGAIVALATLAACASFGASPTGSGGPDGAAPDGGDGGPDVLPGAGLTNPGGTGSDTCNPTGAFLAPIPFPAPINSTAEEFAGFLINERLAIVFASSRRVTSSLFAATRPTTSDPWENALEIAALSTGGDTDSNPCFSRDLLTLYFNSRRGGDQAIWSATRASADSSTFTTVTKVNDIDTSADERDPWINGAGDHLYFASTRVPPGRNHLFVVVAKSGGWNAPTNMAVLNEAQADDQSPVLTKDERTIFFASDRAAAGNHDIYTSTRTGGDATFDPPIMVSELSTTDDEYPTWISENGCAMVLERKTGGKAHLYYTERAP